MASRPLTLRHDLHGRRANQVADDQDLLGDGGPFDHGELDRHRRPDAAAAGAAARATAPGRRGRPGGDRAVVLVAGRGDAEGGTDDQVDGYATWRGMTLRQEDSRTAAN